MIEPLPPALAALIAAERTAPVASATARAAIKARLAASIATAPLGTAASLSLGKVLAIVALTVGAGTATVAAVKSHGHAEIHTVPPAAAIAMPVAVSATPVAPDPAPSNAVATSIAPPVSAVRADPVASQPQLLSQAWAALSRSEPQRALDLVELDVHSHPTGSLVEEREALHVVALARLGRTEQAARAAQVFEAHYPQSIHHSLIAKSLGGVP